MAPSTEKELITLFEEKKTKYIVVYTKSDIKKTEGISVSSLTGDGIEELKEKIAALFDRDEDKRIIGDIMTLDHGVDRYRVSDKND